MNEMMIIKEEILFKANAQTVWNLLVNPEMTKQYMFGCEVHSDWTIGSPVYWKGKTENGEEVLYVKGALLEYEKGKKMTCTMFDPNSDMQDIPENYVNLTYILDDAEDGVLLTIIQGDFAGAENGKKRYEESKAGWKEMVIPIMKKMVNLETL